MKILVLVPGGQTDKTSPSEILVREIAFQRPDWKIHIINMSFSDFNVVKYDLSDIDLVWSDMDGRDVINLGAFIKRKYGMKFYAHGEWIPPYRVFDGYSEKYLCKTELKFRPYYLGILKSMQEADLVSFGRKSDSDGSFDWIKNNFGIEFENGFVRHNYVKRFKYEQVMRGINIATIARAQDKKKRVTDTIKALSLINPKPELDLIGAKNGEISSNLVKINCLGEFDSDEKVNIYRTARMAVQHWSGIPPAEAMTQFCPVVSYDVGDMRYNYGDTIIWAKDGDIVDLANKISYVFNNPEEMNKKVLDNYNKLCNNELKVNFVDVRAKEVIKEIEGIWER